MLQTFFSIYLATAAVITAAVFVMSNRLSDRPRPTAVRLELSVAAGALWPVVLLGVVEFGSCVAYAKASASIERVHVGG